MSTTRSVCSSTTHECHLINDHLGPAHVVRVVGRLDWATNGQLHDVLCEGCPEPVVVIDLTAMTGSDAAGTGTLLVAAARAEERGQQLVVVAPDMLEREVFEATGLGTVVPIVTSEAKAWQWLDAHPECAKHLVNPTIEAETGS